MLAQDRSPILVPPSYNYVAAFLTLDCNYSCGYCINRPTGQLTKRSIIDAGDWITYLNRLQLPADLPISIQGGEPSQHPEFLELILGIRPELSIDILTNLSFDVEQFCKKIPATRFIRKAPYASIRVTYHPGQSDLDELLSKVSFLSAHGYPVGLYSIRKPGFEKLIDRVTQRAAKLSIDHHTKEYLGLSRGKKWGTYRYEGGVFSDQTKTVECRTSELLIAPDGMVYRCHRDLYLKEFSIGSILGDHPYRPEYVFRHCDKFGECNPCDVKLKTNRFQLDGHSSVEIRHPVKLETAREVAHV